MSENVRKMVLDFVEFIKEAPLNDERLPRFKMFVFNIINGLKENNKFSDMIEIEYSDKNDDSYGAMYVSQGKFLSEADKMKHKFLFNTTTKTFKRFYSDNVDVREKSINRFIYYIFHEFRHYLQNKAMYTNVPSKFNMELTKVNIIDYEDYPLNHDLCYFEYDADDYADKNLKGLLDIGFLHDLHIINEANFIESFYVYEGNQKYKIVSRNEYINGICDREVNNHVLPDINNFPMLGYEYNNDSPKKLKQLYDEMNKQISKINSLNIAEKDKNYAINSIKEMFYDIYLYRLSKMDVMEFLTQTSVFETNDVVQLFNQLAMYSSSELEKKKKIIENRRVARERISKGKYMYNTRKMIKVIEKKNSYAMKVDDYFNMYHIDGLDFLKNLVPECGFYLFNDGSKMTVLNFIDEYIIPSKISNIDEYDNLLKRVGVRSLADSEYLNGMEALNKEYTATCEVLNRLRNAYNKKFSMDGGNHYSKKTLENMELIKNICDYNAFVDDYDIKYLVSLTDTAKKLTEDTLLNPNGENYYEMFLFELSCNNRVGMGL
jgi:hypothetical protein